MTTVPPAESEHALLDLGRPLQRADILDSFTYPIASGARYAKCHLCEKDQAEAQALTPSTGVFTARAFADIDAPAYVCLRHVLATPVLGGILVQDVVRQLRGRLDEPR